MFDDLIDKLSDSDIEQLSYDWELWARHAQLPPTGAWRCWLLMAGRGFGKTRTGAEWIRTIARKNAGCEIGLIGATFDDARYVMVEGPSGIMTISPPDERPRYVPSRHQLLWENGSRARLFAADKPSQLRGPEFHFVWADEIAKWRYQEAWDNAMMALRKGKNPQILATTTPRPLAWLADLAAAEDTILVQGKSTENHENLSSAFLSSMARTYGGSLLGRQELDGELLSDVPNALWRRQDLESYRNPAPDRNDFIRIVVGVDPAIGGANETGIIVAGKTADGHIWVLGDYSLQAPADRWAQQVQQQLPTSRWHSSWRGCDSGYRSPKLDCANRARGVEMTLFLSALGKVILDLGQDYVHHKIQDRKSYRTAHQKRLNEAAKSHADWQALMAQASHHSWKDEAWTICFIIILFMCFIPSLQDEVGRGFAILDQTPDWFQWALLASIGASFGLRGFSAFAQKAKKI